jgi:hypothetical protein
MGRKRLLTILAAAALGVGLPASAASAQLGGVPVVGDVVDGVLGEDCVDLDDLSLSELSRLTSDTCLVDDGVVVDTAAAVADATAELAERAEDTGSAATDTVRETTSNVTESVRDATGGERSPAPSAPSGGSSGDEPSSEAAAPRGQDAGGSATSEEATTSTRTVTRSGGEVDRPSAADLRERERQLATVRALRSDLSLGTNLDRGVAGPVVPFGGLSTTSLDLAAPQVADADLAPGVEPGVTPQVANPGLDDGDAIFATSAPLPEREGVPLALQLLATSLVIGSAAVWALSRRSLDTSPSA